MKYLKLNLLLSASAMILLLNACTSPTDNQSNNQDSTTTESTSESSSSEKNTTESNKTNSNSEQIANARQSGNIPGANTNPSNSTSEMSNSSGGETSNKTEKSFNSIEELRAELESQSQRFIKNTDEEISLLGKKGTRVFIPQRSLIRKNGTIATGKVNIDLVECYDHLSFFAHQLTTHTSDGELLETGGMINVIATQNGDTLSLLPEKQMTVMFPKKGKDKEGMLPFLGSENSSGMTEWQIDPKSVQTLDPTRDFVLGQASPIRSKESEFEEIPTEHYLEIGTMAPELGENFEWKFKDSVGTLADWLNKRQITNELIQNSITSTSSNVLVHLSFSSAGKLQTVKSTRLVGQELLDALYVLLRNVPSPDFSNISEKESYPLMLKGKAIRDTRSYSEKFENKYSEYTRGNIAKIPEAELNYYIMNVSSLGWINCDRFSRDNRPKLAYAIRGEDGTNVSVVFTKIKSQIQGIIQNGVFVIQNLPAGEPVRIVAVKRTEEGISVGVSSSFINNNGDKAPATHNATLEEYKNAFAIQ